VKARLYLQSGLVAVLLVLVTIAVYWPTTRCDFVHIDDPEYVTDNPHVQSGLTFESMSWACWNPVCFNWHPLTVWSHALVYQLCGLQPWGHHLANVLLHALNAGLVFVLLQQMTGAAWRSLLVAALFTVHPLRVESVAWVAERKDVLSGFFGLLVLIAYVRYAQKSVISNQWSVNSSPSSGMPAADSRPRTTDHWSLITDHRLLFYFLSLFFFVLGLLSKPMLVTWPFVMLLLDYWPLGRLQLKTQDSRLRTSLPLLIEKLPFCILAALVSVVTFVVQQGGGAVAAVEHLPLGARVENALISYGRYLGKLFWPTELAIYYPHPGRWPLEKVLLAGGLLLGLSVLFFRQRRRAPFLLMGWLWFLGALVPVIGLVQVGDQAMADRYTYLPSLGVLILVVWGACELTRHWRYQVLAWSVAVGVAVVFCLALTRQQIGYWRDSEALFRHAVEVTQNNEFAHNNLGVALDRNAHLDEAIRQFQEAVRLQPSHSVSHYNLGIALDKKGQMAEAIHQFQEAIRLRPAYAEAHYNLGIALGRKGQMDQAIRQYEEAIRLKPAYAEAHNDLGIALGRKGQMDLAIRQFQEAVRLRPAYAEAHFNLGLALGLRGQSAEAIRYFEEALKAKPDYPEAHNYLGSAFYQQGRASEAIRQFQEALRLRPDYGEARKNLDRVLATKADFSHQPEASTNH
jgi:protein O-mannosyl-transferase